MDADPERDPWSGRIGVAGLAQQTLGSLYGARGVQLAGEQRDEQADDLVADELVDQGVVFDEHLRPGLVEAVDQGAERRPGRSFGQFRRAPHVGEQHRELDLRARDAAL